MQSAHLVKPSSSSPTNPSPAKKLTCCNSLASTFPCCVPKASQRITLSPRARPADGTVVEVFEWAAGGVERAHKNPVVLKLWERYAAACDIVPLASLPEASNMFASFTPIDL